MKCIELSLASVEARLRSLAALDIIDLELVKFIAEKFGGEARVNELNAVVVLGALAPRWKELVSIPAIQPFVPQELLNALTTSLAERELQARISKLEALGVLEKGRMSDGSEVVRLTPLGKLLADYGAIPSFDDSVSKIAFEMLKLELPPEEVVVLYPMDRLVVRTKEVVEISEDELCIVVPAPELARLGITVTSTVVRGPYSDRLELVVSGGSVPVALKRGQRIGWALVLRG